MLIVANWGKICVAAHFTLLRLNKVSKYLGEVIFWCFSVLKLNKILLSLICQWSNNDRALIPDYY